MASGYMASAFGYAYNQLNSMNLIWISKGLVTHK